jgi:hypothetical protein
VICGEVQPVVAQGELADDGMVEALDTGVVEAHVGFRADSAGDAPPSAFHGFEASS